MSICENAYFKRNDLWTNFVAGYPIDLGWWSRLYEYPWALEYSGPNLVVADMGCGWQARPFKDALAKTCKKVYAVDQHWEAGKLDMHDNMEYVIADFTQRIDAIPDNSLDRVFCISVLEELGDRIKPALLEFYRCLKPGGLCVITMDVQYDMDKPTPYCGGVDPQVMDDAIDAVRFNLYGGYDGDKSYAMFSEMYNLCVFHYVLVKR